MNSDPDKRYVEPFEVIVATDEWAWNDEDRWHPVDESMIGLVPWVIYSDEEHSSQMFRRKIDENDAH